MGFVDLVAVRFGPNPKPENPQRHLEGDHHRKNVFPLVCQSCLKASFLAQKGPLALKQPNCTGSLCLVGGELVMSFL